MRTTDLRSANIPAAAPQRAQRARHELGNGVRAGRCRTDGTGDCGSPGRGRMGGAGGLERRWRRRARPDTVRAVQVDREDDAARAGALGDGCDVLVDMVAFGRGHARRRRRVGVGLPRRDRVRESLPATVELFAARLHGKEWTEAFPDMADYGKGTLFDYAAEDSWPAQRRAS